MERSTRGGLVLLVIVGLLLGLSSLSNYLNEREQAALKDKREAEARTQFTKEWTESGPAIIADLKKAIDESRGKDAKAALNRYREVAKGALDEYERAAEIAAVVEDLKQIPKDQAIAREGALGQLVVLDPNNPRWKRELVQAQREANAQRQRQVQEAKAIERRMLAERRREGVSIGMTQERVLQSSWGRPEHINRSDYSFGTKEQWVYGNGHYLYFENGVLTSIQTRR
jgi:hypothetical protein